ncbi:MAG: hypothetical protein QOD09_705 [Bradyrhizobium sp.]|jgi:hypothetical protein|nr:hypothetical protein [Bradyrhizobium sp.]
MSAPDSLALFNPAPIPGERTAAPIRDVSLTIVVAAGSIAFAPLLHVTTPILAISVETLIACAIAVAAAAYAPAIAIFMLLFQNLFVSILSPYIADPSQLEFIKGYNFLGCSVMWLTSLALYGLRRNHYSTEVHRLMAWGMLALGTVGVYFLIGFGQDPVAASVYLRNILLPLFLFQLSLLTATTYEVRVTSFFVAIGVILILCGYIEFTFRDFWLDTTNGHAFWRFDEIKATNSGVWEKEMRTTGNVFADLKDRFKFGFLNTPLLDGLGLSEILRIFGPNMSPISFGYGVAFFGLFLFSVGRPLLALAALPLVVFCSVKGALILTVFVCMAWLSARIFGAAATLILGMLALAVYAILGIYTGLQIEDYHVLGFMGGWNGFLQRPFGRGLGIGGNLSEGYSSIDWSAAQQAGAVEGAVESAVGVLLYQMGLAALIPLGFYLAMALKVWRLYAFSGLLTQGLAAFGVMIVLVNGIFQEEALFAPPALGLLMCLTGLAIGNAIRASAAYDVDRNHTAAT